MIERDHEKVNRILEGIEKAKLDALVCRLSENVLTMTGYFPSVGFSYVIVEKDGRITVIAPEQEEPWYRDGWQDETRGIRGIWQVQYPPAPVCIAQTFKDFARDRNLTSARIGYEGSFEVVSAQILAGECNVPDENFKRMIGEAFHSATFVDATPVIDRIRAKKSKRDIEMLRRTCEVAAFAYEALAEACREGRTDAEAAAYAEAAVYAKGVGYKGAKSAHGYAQVSSGVITGDWQMYQPSTQKRIQKGDMILMEIGLHVDGYWADLTRSFVASDKATEEQQAVWEEATRSMNASIEALRPGARAADVDHIGREAIQKYKEWICHHHIGHGLGVKYHEPIPALNPHSNHVLEVGHYVAIEPAIYMPGKFGVRNEENLVITETGSENISSCIPIRLTND